ncbi:MAG: homoserine dehydrogenase, partial [Candidatus Aureabacteria bacterium]|nr:homoserine dehydrogenase [Candidatus Auribacterota bacterium]
IIGFGTVGKGVVKNLQKNAGVFSRNFGAPVELVRIADKDVKTDRGVKLPEGMLVADAESIVNDKSIDIVVELIGGIEPAKSLIKKALANGKSVVTANKALLAEYGEELFRHAGSHNREIFFEASVGGGIPIIKGLREGLAANKIFSIYAIINGTTNYILSRMKEEKVSFKDALKAAKSEGYAEADSKLDISGMDSAHKIVLLSSIASGKWIELDKVYVEGIERVEQVDIEYARELGFVIKLLAVYKEKNNGIEVRVNPTMVDNKGMLAAVTGVYNAILLEGDFVGNILYYGLGAGEKPTASAVVSDILDVSRNMVAGKARPFIPDFPNREKKIIDIGDIRSKYYFRFTVLDKTGVLSRIAGVLGDNRISISSVIQKGRNKGNAVPIVVLTHKAYEKDMREAISIIDKLEVTKGNTVVYRVGGL